ncbi:hypothetical protein ACTXT7_004530 [Hymenolepis weldensis]
MEIESVGKESKKKACVRIPLFGAGIESFLKMANTLLNARDTWIQVCYAIGGLMGLLTPIATLASYKINSSLILCMFGLVSIPCGMMDIIAGALVIKETYEPITTIILMVSGILEILASFGILITVKCILKN